MEAWGLTDLGNVRKQNQDFYEIVPLDRQRMLLVVCDGMGGAKSGNVASRLAAEVFVGEIRRMAPTDMDAPEIEKILRDAVELANTAVFEQSKVSTDFEGMGTTLVAAFLLPQMAVIANVGDSRLYLIHGSLIHQVTRDHSYVEEMVAIGQMRRGSEDYNRRKNIITRALGIGREVEPDFFEVSLNPGDYVLLCSDGLTNMVDNSAIYRMVLLPGTLDTKARALTALANQNGGKDNIAVILIDPQIKEVRES